MVRDFCSIEKYCRHTIKFFEKSVVKNKYNKQALYKLNYWVKIAKMIVEKLQKSIKLFVDNNVK